MSSRSSLTCVIAELNSVDSVDVPAEKLKRECGGLVACEAKGREGGELKKEGKGGKEKLTDVARTNVGLDGEHSPRLDGSGLDVEGGNLPVHRERRNRHGRRLERLLDSRYLETTTEESD
jgi:hypothetical protein